MAIKRIEEDKKWETYALTGQTIGELIECLGKFPKDAKISFASDTSEFWSEVKFLSYVPSRNHICLFNNWP